MAITVTDSGRKRHTLTANQSEKVTLPAWTRRVVVEVAAGAASLCRVGPVNTDSGAVEGSTTPTDYAEVAAGAEESYPVEYGGGVAPYIWVHATGATVAICVSTYKV